ncbi:MAG: hypothetical protein C4348_00335 [Patescibacteria group bacterium]
MTPLEELEEYLEGKKERKDEFGLPIKSKKKVIFEPKEETKKFFIPKKRFYFNFDKFLNALLYLSVFIFALSLIFLSFNLLLKREKPTNIKLSIFGPYEVNSLEESIYTLLIENNSNLNLENVSLSIILSDGGYFLENNEKEKTINIGKLKANTSTKINLGILFLNEGNKEEKINAVLRYKIENKPYSFEDKKIFSILVKNPPIQISPDLPSKIYVFQPFQSTFKIINLSKENLDNLNVKINLPNYFNLISSLPSGENLNWNFSNFYLGDKKTITLIGYFQEETLSPYFDVEVNFSWKGKSFSLFKESYKINLLPSPVKITVTTNPLTESVNIGSNIYYSIQIENKSKINLKENLVKVTFNDLFDISSVKVDNGYFSSLENAVYFTSRYEEKLLNLKPNEKVSLRFNINLIKSYPILGEKQKDFLAKIKIEFRTPSIPPEIEIPNLTEFKINLEDDKKIIGSYEIKDFLVYKDKIFENYGPIPFVNETPTTLSWYLKIKTIGEEFENFSLTGKLPPYVNLTGKVGGDAILDNLKFDPTTGEFSYSINNLTANMGYTEPELTLVFQIVVNPPAQISTYNLEILPLIKYQITSKFTKMNFAGYVGGQSSSEIISELK